MKLTAQDIHFKEFRHSLRGYSEEEVDAFLDNVADEFERLVKENIDMAERLEAADERVRGYQSMEATLNNTLVSAQRSAEEIQNKAGVEADAMLRDAEVRAKEIIHGALTKKQTVATELIRIKQAEEQFRENYRLMLEGKLRDIDAVKLPDDVNVLLDDSDGLIGAVDVRSEPPAASTQLWAPTPAAGVPSQDASTEGLSTTDASPIFDYAAQAPEPIVPEPTGGAAAQPSGEVRLVDPPASGFVSSVALGEVEHPEPPDGPVDLIEPDEFELPGFDLLGERERDSDIEEID
jgi:cell division initiation protein